MRLAEDAVMGNRLPHGLEGSGHLVDMLGGVEEEVNVMEVAVQINSTTTATSNFE